MNLKLLKKLCLARGLSGFEDEIRNIILNEIKDYVKDIKIDSLGNIIVFKKGEKECKKKLLISAHMDEVGFIIDYISEDGFLKFSSVGGISPEIVCGKRVLIGENKISGIIGSKPIHLTSFSEIKKIPKLKELFIDIGAKDKKQAMKYIKLGDFVTFASSFSVQNNKILSKALDDRIGCMILIEMIKKDLKFDTYFSFVVQEEVGLRGAKTASYQVNPDFAIVVESTTAADIFGVAEQESVCDINKGAVITYMDKTTIYDRKFINLAFDLAKKNNVKIQEKRAVAGGNDSGAIHISRSGVRVISFSVPCRYLHSAFSVASIKDIKSTEKILDLFSKTVLNDMDLC